MEQHAKHLSGHEKRLLENALHTGQSGHGVQPVPGQRNADELHARRRLLETGRLQHDFGRLRTGDRQIDHGRAGRIHERRPPLVAGPPRQRSLPAFPTRGRRPVGRHSGIPDGDTRPDERRAGQYPIHRGEQPGHRLADQSVDAQRQQGKHRRVQHIGRLQHPEHPLSGIHHRHSGHSLRKHTTTTRFRSTE